MPTFRPPSSRSEPFFSPTRRAQRGVSLVEAMVSASLLSMLMVGILGALVQSRRLTEGSIYQNSALTIIQGYVEQMKNMEFNDLPYTTSSGTLIAGSSTIASQILTRLDESRLDPLTISTAAIPALSTIGITSANATGIADNIKLIDVNSTEQTNDDLRLNLRVWVQDIGNASISATQVRAITIHYAWQVNEGSRSRVFRGSIRTIRSAVPTF